MLFSDPNGDNNPNDGLLLARDAVSTPSTIVDGDLIDYSFSAPVNIAVGDNFFIGVYEPNGYRIGFAFDGAGGSNTWASFPGDDPTTAVNLNTVDGFGFPNDAMIRAVGTTPSVSAVPEPSSTALLGIGAFALIIRRKK